MMGTFRRKQQVQEKEGFLCGANRYDFCLLPLP